jgi:hypothetical protein
MGATMARTLDLVAEMECAGPGLGDGSPLSHSGINERAGPPTPPKRRAPVRWLESVQHLGARLALRRPGHRACVVKVCAPSRRS